MGFRHDEDIDRGLQQLGYPTLKAALAAEYSKIGPIELARILKVTRYSVSRWMRMFGFPRVGPPKPKAATFEGKPCPRGHTTRWVSNRCCKVCKASEQKRRKERCLREKN